VADRVSSTPSTPPTDGYAIPPRYWSWLGTSWTLVAIVWVAAISCGVGFAYRALHYFDDRPSIGPERQRADGNNGHAQIDFGGQWLMGRMIVTGNGRQLYHRQRQWQVLRDSFPVEDESPIQREEGSLPQYLRTQSKPNEKWEHDSSNLMGWFMGGEQDSANEWRKVGGATVAPLAQPPTGNPFVAIALEKHAADTITPEVVEKVSKPSIGGPLYPPVHAIFYAPLGLLRPQLAYHTFQMLCVMLVPVAGLGVKVLTRGRVWWSVATLCLFLYPGMRGGLDLGQNPVLTLSIVIWGWALASRGYNVAGGMVWGLFAFKPVWALAFFLVPLLMRRWRFCFSMVLTGAAFGLLTLPFVGIETWFNWLGIGKEATELYKVNENWIHLSRDLQGIPRRMLHDFTKPERDRETPLANALAWSLWGVVFSATVLLYLFRGDRSRATGTSAGFLFLGAYLTCFHFMYYDVLISAAVLAVMFADPKQLLRTKSFAVDAETDEPKVPAVRELPIPTQAPKPLGARVFGYLNSFPLTVVLALFVVENSLNGMELEATVGIRYYASPATDGSTNLRVPRINGNTGPNYPLDTFLLMVLWAWAGARLVRRDERKEPEP
jgi:arabinofuranan 3-O-arabinosyltransferase